MFLAIIGCISCTEHSPLSLYFLIRIQTLSTFRIIKFQFNTVIRIHKKNTFVTVGKSLIFQLFSQVRYFQVYFSIPFFTHFTSSKLSFFYTFRFAIFILKKSGFFNICLQPFLYSYLVASGILIIRIKDILFKSVDKDFVNILCFF